MTSSTKQAYNLAVLGARTLKCRRDVSSDQEMTLRAKVMVKVTTIFRTASLLAMLCITFQVSDKYGNHGPLVSYFSETKA